MVRITSLVAILLVVAACFICVRAQDDCVIPKADAKKDAHHPVLNGTASDFSGDTLFAEITGELVQNRTYVSVSFTNANDTKCSLGSSESVWEQSVGDCKDRFALALPWYLHNSCGMKVSNRTGTHFQYHGVILVTYEDKFDLDVEPNEEVPIQVMTRKVTVHFDVYISFQKFISVFVEEVIVKSEVNVTAVVSQFIYSSETEMLTIELTTVVQYPNRLVPAGGHFFLPNDMTANGAPVMSNVMCSTATNSLCKQTIVITANKTADCDFNGNYGFNGTVVTCRDADYSHCTIGLVLLEFKIQNSGVCGSVDTKPFLDGDLTAHRTKPPAVGAAPEAVTEFLVGDEAFFLTTIITEDNSATMAYKEIWLTSPADPSVHITMYRNGARTGNGTMANFRLDADERIFTMVFTSNAFPVAPMSYIFYTVHATVQVDFADNSEKREIRTFSTQHKARATGLSTSTRVGLYSDASVLAAEDTPVTTNVQATNALSTNMMAAILAVAGLVVVVAVVAAVVIVKKSKNSNEYSRI